MSNRHEITTTTGLSLEGLTTRHECSCGWVLEHLSDGTPCPEEDTAELHDRQLLPDVLEEAIQEIIRDSKRRGCNCKRLDVTLLDLPDDVEVPPGMDRSQGVRVAVAHSPICPLTDAAESPN